MFARMVINTKKPAFRVFYYHHQIEALLFDSIWIPPVQTLSVNAHSGQEHLWMLGSWVLGSKILLDFTFQTQSGELKIIGLSMAILKSLLLLISNSSLALKSVNLYSLIKIRGLVFGFQYPCSCFRFPILLSEPRFT